MKFLFLSFYLILFFNYSILCAQSEKDSIKTHLLNEVIISGVKAKDKNPVTFTNVTKKQIQEINFGQDIPILLNQLPSVVSTSDAGNGVGYTYMRLRGTDSSRINVTLNGIPFNDSESHGTFFVNLPDFSSSLESIQVQRGVGTSTNGSGAFGASVLLQTNNFSKDAYASFTSGIGSFNTNKNTFLFSTGLNKNIEINGRLSKINSDGYIDRAFSDLFGYLLNINYITEKNTLKLITFGGKEKTYQAWYGIEDPETLKNNRTFNAAGMYFDENGNMKFYDNETDNYWQHHFQLHFLRNWNSKLSSSVALHYTNGKGYFEQYKEDETLSNYFLPSYFGENTADIIRQRWLANNFFGTTFTINYKHKTTEILLGGALNRYLGKHFGKVIYTTLYTPENNLYYNNIGNKDDATFYTKATHFINNKISAFADIQYRMVFYKANSTKFDNVNDTFKFFNPKVGFNYLLNNKNQLYAYFGIANREPRRDDYENGSIKPEKLFDYELGFKHAKNNFKLNVNAFYMFYENQLVMTGALNDVGAPIFANSGKSFRAGLEIESSINLNQKISIHPNIAVSKNKNIDFYFNRNGVLESLGNTNIAFSPNFVASNAINYTPIKNLSFLLLSKSVGEQFMGNIDAKKSLIDAYFINDLVINYSLNPKKWIKNIKLSLLINNLLNKEYISNGYFYTYDDDSSGSILTYEGAGYFPQATRNFIASATIVF